MAVVCRVMDSIGWLDLTKSFGGDGTIEMLWYGWFDFRLILVVGNDPECGMIDDCIIVVGCLDLKHRVGMYLEMWKNTRNIYNHGLGFEHGWFDRGWDIVYCLVYWDYFGGCCVGYVGSNSGRDAGGCTSVFL